MPTLEQNRAALVLANEVRTKRAALKRDIATGTIALGPFIGDPPAWLRTAHVETMLRAVPGIGGRKAARILADAGIGLGARVGNLTLRQRLALRDAIETTTRRRAA